MLTAIAAAAPRLNGVSAFETPCLRMGLNAFAANAAFVHCPFAFIRVIRGPTVWKREIASAAETSCDGPSGANQTNVRSPAVALRLSRARCVLLHGLTSVAIAFRHVATGGQVAAAPLWLDGAPNTRCPQAIQVEDLDDRSGRLAVLGFNFCCRNVFLLSLLG